MRLALIVALCLLATPATTFDIDQCKADGNDPQLCLDIAVVVIRGMAGPLSAEMCAAYENDESRHLCYDAFLTVNDNPYFRLRDEFGWRDDNFAAD